MKMMTARSFLHTTVNFMVYQLSSFASSAREVTGHDKESLLCSVLQGSAQFIHRVDPIVDP